MEQEIEGKLPQCELLAPERLLTHVWGYDMLLELKDSHRAMAN